MLDKSCSSLTFTTCVYGQVQLEGSSEGERNTREAHAEKVFWGRERESIWDVGDSIELKEKEGAAGESFMDQHSYDTR